MNTNLFESFIKNKSKDLSPTSISKLEWNVKEFSKTIEYEDVRNVLIYGEVQSGKTNTLIGSIFDLIDNGVRLIVLFTSNLDSLHFQTLTRLTKEINDISSSDTNIRINATLNEIKKYNLGYDTYNSKPVTIVLLKKHVAWIDALDILLLNNSDQFSKNSVNKIYVFDDEADWSFSDEKEVKTINKKINETLDRYSQSGIVSHYVPITATPYIFFLSYNEILTLLKPDYIHILKNNWNTDDVVRYHGLEWMASSSKLLLNISNKLDDKEAVFLSLLRFIYHFSLAGKIKNPLLLINNNLKNDDHDKVYDDLIDAIEKIVKINPTTFSDLMSTIFAENKSLSEFDFEKSDEIKAENFNKIMYQLTTMYSIRKNSEMIERFIIIQNQNRSIVVKGDISDVLSETQDTMNEIRENFVDLTSNDEIAYFIIGGNKISRGITFNNLLVMLILNNSPTADTMLQRARWFGYKSDDEASNMSLLINDDVERNFEKLIFPLDTVYREIITSNNGRLNPTNIKIATAKITRYLNNAKAA